MDYVVYGTGYGATLMLLGYALRTWGPKFRFADHDEGAYDRREYRSARSAWTRFTNGLGTTIATCGAVLVLFTFLLMLINPGDSVGVMVALSISAIALIAVAVWAWLYFDRYGSWGVLATPQPLSNYQPLQYDSRESVSGQVANADADHVEHDEARRDVIDDEEVAEEHEDEGEFAARYSKYASHHPDGRIDRDLNTTDDATADEVADDASADVPEGVEPDESLEEMDGAESPRDDEVSSAEDGSVDDAAAPSEDDTADEATPETDVSPAAVTEADTDESDAGETVYEDEVLVVTAVEDDSDDDTLDVIPEAHDDAGEPALRNDPADDDDEAREAGGREEALRRLRERQEQRRSERDGDA